MGLTAWARWLYGGRRASAEVVGSAGTDATVPIVLLTAAVGWATMRRWSVQAWPGGGRHARQATALWALGWIVVATGGVITLIDHTAADGWLALAPIAAILLFSSLMLWAWATRGHPNP